LTCKKDIRVSNRKKAYFIHIFSYLKVLYQPFSFNKVVSKLGSVNQERPSMVKKKKEEKKEERREMSKKKKKKYGKSRCLF
jgi:hypothetical protein